MRPFRLARVTRLALLVPLLALALPACARLGQNDPEGENATMETAFLRVQNENFNDIEIYLVRSGLRTRIGRVGAGRTEQFTLRPAQLGTGDVSFLAMLTIGNGGVSSGSLVVSGGQTVQFHITPVISQSIAVVQ